MKLSTIYKKHVDLIGVFLEKSAAAANFSTKDSLKEAASSHQIVAGNIAHCIALYGDVNVDKEELAKLVDSAINLPCVYANPWTRGLYAILKDV